MSNEVAVKEDVNVFAIFDRLDDQIILAELENRLVDTWVYHFQQQGQEIWGLSKKGVDQALMELEKQGVVYDEEPVRVERDPSNPDYMLFFSTVRKSRYDANLRKIDMGSSNGHKRQCIKLKSGAEDQFWFEKGAAKATRNAKSRTIPVEIETKIITLAKTKGKVKKVEPEEAPPVEHKTEKPTEYQEQKSSSAMIEQLKKMVDKKLQGDWSMILKEYDWKSKEEAFLMLTIAQGNSILKWLSTIKG